MATSLGARLAAITTELETLNGLLADVITPLGAGLPTSLSTSGGLRTKENLV